MKPIGSHTNPFVRQVLIVLPSEAEVFLWHSDAEYSHRVATRAGISR